MSRPEISHWLTRNLVVLSGVSLLQDAASELLYPVLPLFLTAVLGAPAAVVGLVEGIAEGGAAAAKLVSGRLTEQVARRLGKGIRGTPRDALLADDVPVAALGRVYGFHRTADMLGALIG